MGLASSPGTAYDASQPPAGMLDDGLEETAAWRERYRTGLADRARFEAIWELAEAFAANRQWTGYHEWERRVVELPNPDDRERVTVNVLTQYLYTFTGKVTQDDLMPDITWRNSDVGNRAYAKQSRAAAKWGWDEEWRAERKIRAVALKMAVYGSAAIRVRPDPTWGRKIGRFLTDESGRPMMDPEKANAELERLLAAGKEGEYRDFQEGRLAWEPLAPGNIIVPPGLEDEEDFPWLIIDRPVELKVVRGLFPGEASAALKEESIRGRGVAPMRSSDTPDIGSPLGKLRGHVALKTGYELPCPEYPEGQTFVWAQGRKLAQKEGLPFTVSGRGHHGVVFFHYHKLPGRFWALGMIEPAIGPQRQRNRTRSQWIEMKDRAGLGRVYAWDNVITEVSKPKGGVFELVKVQPGLPINQAIHETSGTPPGPWLSAEVDQNDADLDKVMGVREVSLGSAPAGVSAYSAFALLAEQDDRRVGPVLKEMRSSIADLLKISLDGMRRYWLPNKMIQLAGDDPDGLLDSFLYDASKLPIDHYVEVNTSAPLPQSQAAEVQKIFDLFDRSISSGQPLPLDWLYDSLAQGKALPLPKRDQQVQIANAQMENVLLMHGHPMTPNPFDVDELHVQQHNESIAAMSLVPGMEQGVQMIAWHRDLHMQQAAAKAAQQAPTNNGQYAAPGQGTPGQNAGMGQMASAQQANALPPSGGPGSVAG